MKESIGNAYIFQLVIVVIFIITTIVLTSLSYSKTYKIKNRLLEIVDKYHGVSEDNLNDVKNEIETFLKFSGYATVRPSQNSCPEIEAAELVIPEGANEIYRYCIYSTATVTGYYNTVVVYMTIELPLISEFIRLEFPMSGETKIYYQL